MNDSFLRPRGRLPSGLLLLDWKKNAAHLAPRFEAWTRRTETGKNTFDLALIVPPGETIDSTIELDWVLAGEKPAHGLVVVGERARIRLLVRVTGNGEALQTVIVGPNADLEIVHVHDALERETFSQDTHTYKDARLVNAHAYFGANVVRANLENALEEEGAVVRHVDLSLLDQNQLLIEKLLQAHKVPNGTSRSVQKSVLLDDARCEFDGMIKIFPNAQKSDALLEAHASLLSNRAQSRMIPGLEIEANDVKCTHSATSAQFSEDQFFYLHARGIPPREAKRMIVKSFLESTTLSLSEAAQAAIDARIEQTWARQEGQKP